MTKSPEMHRLDEVMLAVLKVHEEAVRTQSQLTKLQQTVRNRNEDEAFKLVGQWEDAVKPFMPADYKDYHENAREEKPLAAGYVFRSLTRRAKAGEEAVAAIDRVIESDYPRLRPEDDPDNGSFSTDTTLCLHGKPQSEDCLPCLRAHLNAAVEEYDEW